MSPGDKVATLKHRLEIAGGTQTAGQRLLCNGVLMVEERTLRSYGLRDNSVILAVPHLRVKTSRRHDHAPDTSRGFLMVPGCGEPWRPEISGKVTLAELDGHFDSSKLPAP